MGDRTTKLLLLLIFLALVFNAFVMLAHPTQAQGGQVGRYAISAWGYGGVSAQGNLTGNRGYYRVDTITGDVIERQ
jgi:hypothetical protein